MSKESSKHELRSISIEKAENGASVVHHFNSSERGHYVEPKTHVMTSHKKLMSHIEEHCKEMGSGKDWDDDAD